MIRKKTLGRTRTTWVLIAGLMTALASAPATVSAADGPWTNLGANAANTDGALNGEVHVVVVAGNDVYVGGNFTNAGGVAAADYVAMWDGNSWSALGSDGAGGGAINDEVYAIHVIGSDVYVGGWFEDAGGVSGANRLARWNGSSWSRVGGAADIDGGVASIASAGDKLYIGGNFTSVGGVDNADRVAVWNGTSWSGLGSDGAGGGVLNSDVRALVVDGDNVFVGGSFTDVAGISTADYVARWNGSSWSALGSNGAGGGALDGDVHALVKSGDSLYVTGFFTNAGGVATADHVARWNGTGWSGLGSNGAGDGYFTQGVRGAVASGGTLYVGSRQSWFGVFRWAGSSWARLGSPTDLNKNIDAVAMGTNSLYAGGAFTNAAGNARADYVTRWAFDPAVRKPDGRIRKGSGGTLVGNDVYNADGANQTRSARKARGEVVNFYISIQNDGNVAERYKVKAAGSTSKYSVRYFRGTTNITSAVVAGTWETPKLAPGSAVTIRARVKVLSTATIGSSLSRLVTIRSKSDSLRKDAVKFVVKRK